MKKFFTKWSNWLVVAVILVMALLNDVAALGTVPIIFGVSSNAFSGVGTQFKRGDSDSSEEFIKVAEVNTISGPDMTRDTIDVTSLDSTSGFREFIPSFRDGGQIVLEMNFTIDSFDELLIDFNSDDIRNYQIVWADTGATTFNFAAYCIGLVINTTLDDKVTATATFKISGEVSLTS